MSTFQTSKVNFARIETNCWCTFFISVESVKEKKPEKV